MSDIRRKFNSIKIAIGRTVWILPVLLILSFLFSCEDPTSGKIENLAPQTYLSIFPDSTIAPGSTLITIRWWGDDPDGFITGYRVSFDSVNWGYTTDNDSTFALSINGSDSTFRFFVSAVDDQGLIDPTPATNLYPVVNSAPAVTFEAGTELPDTSFTIASFKWIGSDPDGEENIASYLWSLNDTINFRRVPASITLLTLNSDSGIIANANNVFYLRAVDEAGALSPIVRMPDTSRTWHVKAVTSKILMVRDIPSANLTTATQYFANALDTISYDMIDIKSNNGALIPKIVNPMWVETLGLFDVVFWVGGTGSVANAANFSLAQESLPYYLLGGGKVFFSSGFQGVGVSGQGSLINFAPVDSVTSCTIPFINITDSNLTQVDNSYPVIGSSSLITAVKGVYTQAQVIYTFFNGQGCTTSPIVVCFKDAPINPRIVYMTLPVYFLNRDPNASKVLFRRIFIGEFGIN
ncbi:MAG: hypothetical protein WBC65_06505 [Ignavibacteria bacterium]